MNSVSADHNIGFSGRAVRKRKTNPTAVKALNAERWAPQVGIFEGRPRRLTGALPRCVRI